MMTVSFRKFWRNSIILHSKWGLHMFGWKFVILSVVCAFFCVARCFGDRFEEAVDRAEFTRSDQIMSFAFTQVMNIFQKEAADLKKKGELKSADYATSMSLTLKKSQEEWKTYRAFTAKAEGYGIIDGYRYYQSMSLTTNERTGRLEIILRKMSESTEPYHEAFWAAPAKEAIAQLEEYKKKTPH